MDRSLKRGGGFVKVLSLFLDDAEHPVCWRKMRIQLDRMVALLERHLKVAPIKVDHGEIAPDDR